MQNPDNLRTLTGSGSRKAVVPKAEPQIEVNNASVPIKYAFPKKRRRRKRAIRSSHSGQPTTNPYWLQLTHMQTESIKKETNTPGTSNEQGSGDLNLLGQNEEPLVELTDDSSPKAPQACQGVPETTKKSELLNQWLNFLSKHQKEIEVKKQQAENQLVLLNHQNTKSDGKTETQTNRALKAVASNSNNNIQINLIKDSDSTRRVSDNQNKKKLLLIDPCGYPKGYPKGIPRTFLLPTPTTTSNAPIWPGANQAMTTNPPTLAANTPNDTQRISANEPIFLETENQHVIQQPYSPSDVYAESPLGDASEAPESEVGQSAQKRLSAFQRLGPVSQPKKPKLTINLMLNKEQAVREVVDETEDGTDKYTPVHFRQDMITSTDETVMKYLVFWPWKKRVEQRKKVTARTSRSVMILEQEQMEEMYEKDNLFIVVSVTGYPKSWRKEDVLDALLEAVKGKSFIPCFIEFTQEECKFLVLRSRLSLIAFHKMGFVVHRDDVELKITISAGGLSLHQIDFIPRLVLRKRIIMGYDSERKLNLSEFTLKEDISHFLYFPLNRPSNQTELIQLQSTVAWDYLTDLDLSRNRLTSIINLDLTSTTPRLKNLNLSYNYIEKMTSLLSCRELSLHSLWLEGNPLCHDYIDSQHYVKIVKMMFSSIKEIDGVPITLKGDLPPSKRNFCPEDAAQIVEKFLEVYFPLMDTSTDDRSFVQNMYADNAVMTITYKNKLRHNPAYRCFRNLFLRSRALDEGETDSVETACSIVKLINRWPEFEHDPFKFTVDVLHHGDFSTILRVGGVVKLKAESLAEDEHLLAFTRTFVLRSRDGIEYKIENELVYWDQPSEELAATAFQVTTVKTKQLNLKMESTPSDNLKEKLLEVFMKLTTLGKKPSERCLELKNWNIQQALEHFTKLLKLDSLESLTREDVS